MVLVKLIVDVAGLLVAARAANEGDMAVEIVMVTDSLVNDEVLDDEVLDVREVVLAVELVVVVVEGKAVMPSTQPFSSEPSGQSGSPSHW